MINGLGTALRALLASLDDEVQSIYETRGSVFRPRYFPAWQFLSERGEGGVGELAEWASVTQPAMTQTLNAMDKAGLVEVQEGKDRRRRIYKLTVAGEEEGEGLAKIFAATTQAATELEREAGTDLRRSIASLLHHLGERSFSQRIEDKLEGDH